MVFVVCIGTKRREKTYARTDSIDYRVAIVINLFVISTNQIQEPNRFELINLEWKFTIHSIIRLIMFIGNKMQNE